MSAHVPLCVYVLTPCLAPRHLLKSYVGFSNNPLRRIRKHNGEIQGGARRTREHRPWEFAAVVAGLPSKSLALQLEWALQHPKRGLKTRAHVAVLQGKRGIGAVGTVRRKMTELRLILTQCEPWKGMDLCVHFATRELLETGQEFASYPLNITTRLGEWWRLQAVRAHPRRGSAAESASDEADEHEERENAGHGSQRPMRLSPASKVASRLLSRSSPELGVSALSIDDMMADIITPLAISGRKHLAAASPIDLTKSEEEDDV